MPRRPRGKTGGYLFHVLNRAVGRATIFEKATDYASFARVLQEAREWVPTMRLLDFCVMPNHWHLVVWPQHDSALSEYLRWLTVTHTSRWHLAHGTTGTGPLYQGRFKSFRSRRMTTSSQFAATSNATHCARTWFLAQSSGVGQACGIASTPAQR
jgi:putative transposase